MVRRLPNNDPARLARIQDANWLHHGIDAGALAKQVEAKQAEKAGQAEAKRSWAALSTAQGNAALHVHHLENKSRANAMKQTQAFRQEEQGREKGRDWDLSRSDQLKLDRPVRSAEESSRYSPSSLQRLAGEDLLAEQRRSGQIQENRTAWGAQKEAKAAQAAATAAAKSREQALVRALDAVHVDCKIQEAVSRRAHEQDALHFNKALASHQKAVEADEVALEKQQDLAEITHAMQTPDWRPVAGDFKGFAKDKLDSIRVEQRQQLEQKAQARSLARLSSLEAAKHQQKLSEALFKEQLGAELKGKALARQAADELQKQAREKQLGVAKTRSKDSITLSPGFFDQFGTSHR